ncbi:MFS transporter [Aminobacter sp. MET-1]|uniref:MFS transporter n=1 Tax=Aminobacter sp. MET-1 TaxID=2951085 RepID=UPI00226AF056|nr:MFS transporter [Aminobacter sp. MET-1]MCX8569443.1 MFS transporter [Aminobacter sp. MET-1]
MPLRAFGEKTGQTIVLLLIAGSGMVAIARGMTLTFLAIRLQQDFGLSPAAIGMLIGAGPLLGAAASPFAGTLSDRIGRRSVLTVALLFAGLGLIGLGLAQSVAAFAIAHIVSSVAAAVYEPVSRALMSDAAPEKLRLKVFSWRYLVINAGWAVGPMIGIAIGANSPMPFFIAGAVHFAFSAAIFLIVPAVFVGTAGAGAAAQIPGFRRLVATLRDRRLIFYLGGGTLLLAVYGQWSVTLSQYLTTNLEDGVKIFAWLVTTNAAVVVFATAPARMLIERIGPMKAMVLGCLLFLGGEVGFAFATSATMLIGFMVLFTIGEVLVVPSEYVLVDRISNDGNRGAYFGAHSLCAVGNFFGPLLGGLALGAFGGQGMFMLFAAFAAGSAVLFALGYASPPPASLDGHAAAVGGEATEGAMYRVGRPAYA